MDLQDGKGTLVHDAHATSKLTLYAQMVEGGWYYCPTPESDDLVRCCYCSLSLDGWESKDDPQ